MTQKLTAEEMKIVENLKELMRPSAKDFQLKRKQDLLINRNHRFIQKNYRTGNALKNNTKLMVELKDDEIVMVLVEPTPGETKLDTLNYLYPIVGTDFDNIIKIVLGNDYNKLETTFNTIEEINMKKFLSFTGFMFMEYSDLSSKDMGFVNYLQEQSTNEIKEIVIGEQKFYIVPNLTQLMLEQSFIALI